MKNLLKRIPVPISGVMLASASAGNLLSSYGAIFKTIFGTISAIILLFLILKLSIDIQSILEDFKNPIIASVTPSFAMGVMVLSTYIRHHLPNLAYFLWIIAIVFHVFLILYFTKKYAGDFDPKEVFPGYLVVYVGITVGSVTAGTHDSFLIGKALFWFGLISAILLLPILVYRVFVLKTIPEALMPTIVILVAPPNVCLAGYINSFSNHNVTFIWLFLMISLVIFVMVLGCMPKLLKLPFYPSCSALTFPFVISATATKSAHVLLNGLQQNIVPLIYITWFQEAIAILSLFYVLFRYIFFILTPSGNKQLNS